VINPGRSIYTLGLLLVLATASICVQAQQQRVDVQLSSNRVSADESVMLNVRAYGIDAEIDTSALDKDFDVTNRSSSRQVTIENGKRTSIVEWVLELSPNRAGALEIPPIIVGSEQSRPLTLLVEQPASGAARDMYLEASVDESEPYFQAQVIYTLRVFQDVRFLEATLKVPEVDGLVMQQISEEKNYQETVNGRAYVVSEIRYSVFPQQSGTVVIPPIVLQAVITADKNQLPNTRTRTRRIKRRANEVELNVKARPDGLQGRWWLPAKAVTLNSEWSSPIDALEVDQPVTRTIKVQASGVGEEQLPELTVPAVNNIGIYADKPTAVTSTSEQGLMSEQTNTWAVIPQQAGKLVMPEMTVNWFDTTTGEARVAVLPAETITVVQPTAAVQAGNGSGALTSQTNIDQTGQTNTAENAAAIASDTDAIAEDTVSDSITNTSSSDRKDKNTESALLGNALNTDALQAVHRWRNFVAVLLAGWVLSLLGLWLWMRKRYSVNPGHAGARPDQSESDTVRFQRRAGSRAALDPIKAACDTADVSNISREVLSWADMVWPGSAPTHLTAVAKRLNSEELAQVFDAIDAQQFRPTGSVKPVAFEQIPSLLKKAIDQYQEVESGTTEPHALPSL